MVDAFTTFAAAAAAAQFVEQAVAVTKYFYQTFANIHDAPDDVLRNLAQIEQLISLSRLIISNKAVQTDSIDSILRLCLRDSARLQDKLKNLTPATDAGKIEQLRKAFMATFKKDAVQKLLERLDRQKMSLALAMHEINS